MKDVRFGKPRAHKRDMARRHDEYAEHLEAEENNPLPLVETRPARVKL